MNAAMVTLNVFISDYTPFTNMCFGFDSPDGSLSLSVKRNSTVTSLKAMEAALIAQIFLIKLRRLLRAYKE